METVFSKWIGSLTVNQYREAREEISRILGISKQAFWFWTKGKREPSEINNIRIAYYAQQNGLPNYMADTITVNNKLIEDNAGNKYIRANIRINNNFQKQEERYVVYNQ